MRRPRLLWPHTFIIFREQQKSLFSFLWEQEEACSLFMGIFSFFDVTCWVMGGQVLGVGEMSSDGSGVRESATI